MKTRCCLLFVVMLFQVVLFSEQAIGVPTPIHANTPSSVAETTYDPGQGRYSHATNKAKRNQVALSINVIYAHVRNKAFMDPALKRDLPVLHGMYDFNAYRLLKQYRYRLDYQQAIIIPISYRFQVQLSPTQYVLQQKSIVFQVTFLYRKREKNQLQARFTQYASLEVSLRSGSQIAFLGPSIDYGRSLITLRAKNKPRK